MDVRTLCLAVLSGGEASGYEIRKALQEAPLGHFQDAAYGSIYPALLRLSNEGLVNGTALSQEKRPDKKVYALTASGERALRQALMVAPGPDKFRSDFLLILYLADQLPPEFIVDIIDERMAEYESCLADMDDCDACLEHPGTRFVHGFGQAWYRAALEYLRENRDRFAAELVEMKRRREIYKESPSTGEKAAPLTSSVLIGE